MARRVAARPSFYSAGALVQRVRPPSTPSARQRREMDLERSCVCMRCRPQATEIFDSKPAVTVESTVEPLHISICSENLRAAISFGAFAAH